MRKFIKVFLVICSIISSCFTPRIYAETPMQNSIELEEQLPEILDGVDLSDKDLLKYIEDDVYNDLISNLDSEEYFIENVNTIYISKEYLEEVAFNSQENIYFGYSLSDLNTEFAGSKYIFTLGDDGQTIVQEFENYDNTFGTITKNVAIGSGVILICVTVSIVGAPLGAPAAVTSIIAASAKTGTAFALSSATISAIVKGAVTGYQTNDFRKAMKDAALAGSEAFKWGAITGAITGGALQYSALKGATLEGLTMNQAAQIQKESKYPLDVIKQLQSMEQYEILKEAGITAKMINGKNALIRNIDLSYVDDFGLTNLERMKNGLAAIDPDGISYELHHLAQNNDATLAILSKAEHMQNGNNKIWHLKDFSDVLHGNSWDKQRQDFWKSLATMFEMGGVSP